jgi:Fe-S-cluster containining protein
MFVVGDALISDTLLDAPFACNLGACLGACCVHGESGAPLEPEERAVLEAVVPRVRKYLRREALAVIAERGVWEEAEPGAYATTCVDDAECVFVTYDGPVAKCAIHTAHLAGRVDYPKPISCHLFPLRVEPMGDFQVINYEQVSLCDSARRHGRRHRILLVDTLGEALTRTFGVVWYAAFQEAYEERLQALRPIPGDDREKGLC